MKNLSRISRLTIGGLIALTSVAAIAPIGVSANDADIIKRGDCSGRTDWKLKLSPENGRIEVEFEVDSSRVGRTWSVRLRQNGERFFIGNRTTGADGEIEVRFVRNNTAGPDTFKARAIDLTNGEVCVGQATF